MSTSLDGKLGPARTDRFVSITSSNDLDHLKRLRDGADAVLFGAATYRAWPKVHRGFQTAKKIPHFIMTRSLNLDVNTPLFQELDIPITIFSTLPAISGISQFPENTAVVVCPDGPDQIASIIEHVKSFGVDTLLIEGGGKILNQFIEARMLHEIFLTIAPIVLGQSDAPGLLGGLELSRPQRMRLLSSTQNGDECYLHLQMGYTS